MMDEDLKALLKELAESEKMPDRSDLYALSSLPAEEAARVAEVWHDLPTDLRIELINALVEIAEADFEALFGAVYRVGIEDQEPAVRARAIEGLWEDRDVRLVPVLADRLREDESARVRAAAATSLGRFILLGELEKIRPAPRTEAYECLMAACQRESEPLEVRRRAMESLAYTENETIVEMIETAYQSPHEEERISAVFAMGRSANPRWAVEVRRELISPNPAMRYEAARASGELQLNECVPDLEELSEDVDREVQEAAIWALGQIGGDKARAILERHLESDDAVAQAAAEAAINQLEFLHGDVAGLFDRLLEDLDAND